METSVDASEVSRLVRALDQATGRLSGSYQTIAALQAELAQKERELAHRSRLEMLGRMAATVAHEVRNPLGGIQLYAEMLRRDAGDPVARENCDRILGAVADLSRLVDDMLTYGRDAEPIRLPHELEPLIEEALALSSIEGRVRVVRRYTLRRPVFCDADMIQRVFLNLTRNAGQSMDGGALLVETALDNGRARIVFHDTGPGILPAILPRLFTPFVTTRTKGTGLGLAIAHKIIEAHGGTITAQNVSPHGAEFTMHLPL